MKNSLASFAWCTRAGCCAGAAGASVRSVAGQQARDVNEVGTERASIATLLPCSQAPCAREGAAVPGQEYASSLHAVRALAGFRTHAEQELRRPDLRGHMVHPLVLVTRPRLARVAPLEAGEQVGEVEGAVRVHEEWWQRLPLRAAQSARLVGPSTASGRLELGGRLPGEPVGLVREVVARGRRRSHRREARKRGVQRLARTGRHPLLLPARLCAHAARARVCFARTSIHVLSPP